VRASSSIRFDSLKERQLDLHEVEIVLYLHPGRFGLIRLNLKRNSFEWRHHINETTSTTDRGCHRKLILHETKLGSQ